MTVVGAPLLWSPRFRATTAGLFLLSVLFAFESFAIATVMPVVGREFDALSSYPLAFAAPIAVSVFAICLAGVWIDRAGPGAALYVGVAVFAAGLICAALAPGMPVFLAGRAVQGFGSGLAGVALYVLVAVAYPEELRARVFTVLTSGWVLPALIGPPVAGGLADAAGWRWVFAVAPLPATVAAVALIPAVRQARPPDTPGRTAPSLWWAGVAAVAVLVVGVAGRQEIAGWPLAAAVAVAAVFRSVPRLVPAGTWRFAAGLPAVLSARSLTGAAFFGAEVYVPLALVQFHGFTPAHAGMFLTVSALAWFAGSWIAAHVPVLSDAVLRVRWGTAAVAVGIGASATVLRPEVWPAVPLIGWSVASLGIGIVFSSASVLLLDYSPPEQTGANSAAMQVNDAVAQSVWLCAGGTLFAASAAAAWGFAAMFAGAAVVAAGAYAAAARITASSSMR
ncbi:MFS transporter [Rhodococcus phenolicus]|uniref:MFS transporter n=1 Tax=Rhodococcus phenolicus TaxID=263849 RepID=UPI00082EF789|nr:MFS transporter [Rhodococcus phenolicus]